MTTLHLGCDEARTVLAYPLTTLAWLEATALKMELAPYLKRSRQSDVWYVSQGEETFGPVPFAKIVRMLLRGEGPLPVLHESEIAQEPPPWHTLAYRGWPMSKAVRIAWIVCCWLFAVAVGYVLVSLAVPMSTRPIAGVAYLLAVAVAGVWLGLRARRGGEAAEEESETAADPEPPSEGELE